MLNSVCTEGVHSRVRKGHDENDSVKKKKTSCLLWMQSLRKHAPPCCCAYPTKRRELSRCPRGWQSSCSRHDKQEIVVLIKKQRWRLGGWVGRGHGSWKTGLARYGNCLPGDSFKMSFLCDSLPFNSVFQLLPSPLHTHTPTHTHTREKNTKRRKDKSSDIFIWSEWTQKSWNWNKNFTSW